MKFLLPVIITIMALFAPLSLFAVGKNGDQHIKSIFFQKNEGREIVQIRLSEKVVPKIFELDGEKPRVVLDLGRLLLHTRLGYEKPVQGK